MKTQIERAEKTAVDKLDDDLLFASLKNGAADQGDQKAAAAWIARLTSMLTYDQNKAMRDGYEPDEVDPEARGAMRAALSNALRDRIVTVAESLSPSAPTSDTRVACIEIAMLARLYPKKGIG